MIAATKYVLLCTLILFLHSFTRGQVLVEDFTNAELTYWKVEGCWSACWYSLNYTSGEYGIPPLPEERHGIIAQKVDSGQGSGTARLVMTEKQTFTANGYIEITFWITSTYAEASNLVLYRVTSTGDSSFKSLTKYSTPTNREWITVRTPVPITGMDTFQLCIYGYKSKGLGNEVMIERIVVSLDGSEVPSTTTFPVSMRSAPCDGGTCDYSGTDPPTSVAHDGVSSATSSNYSTTTARPITTTDSHENPPSTSVVSDTSSSASYSKPSTGKEDVSTVSTSDGKTTISDYAVGSSGGSLQPQTTSYAMTTPSITEGTVSSIGTKSAVTGDVSGRPTTDEIPAGTTPPRPLHSTTSTKAPAHTSKSSTTSYTATSVSEEDSSTDFTGNIGITTNSGFERSSSGSSQKPGTASQETGGTSTAATSDPQSSASSYAETSVSGKDSSTYSLISSTAPGDIDYTSDGNVARTTNTPRTASYVTTGAYYVVSSDETDASFSETQSSAPSYTKTSTSSQEDTSTKSKSTSSGGEFSPSFITGTRLSSPTAKPYTTTYIPSSPASINTLVPSETSTDPDTQSTVSSSAHYKASTRSGSVFTSDESPSEKPSTFISSSSDNVGTGASDLQTPTSVFSKTSVVDYTSEASVRPTTAHPDSPGSRTSAGYRTYTSTSVPSLSTLNTTAPDDVLIDDFDGDLFDNWVESWSSGASWQKENRSGAVNGLEQVPTYGGVLALVVNQSAGDTGSAELLLQHKYQFTDNAFINITFWIGASDPRSSTLTVYRVFDEQRDLLVNISGSSNTLKWSTVHQKIPIGPTDTFQLAIEGSKSVGRENEVLIDRIFISGVDMASSGSTDSALITTTPAPTASDDSTDYTLQIVISVSIVVFVALVLVLYAYEKKKKRNSILQPQRLRSTTTSSYESYPSPRPGKSGISSLVNSSMQINPQRSPYSNNPV